MREGRETGRVMNEKRDAPGMAQAKAEIFLGPETENTCRLSRLCK